MKSSTSSLKKNSFAKYKINANIISHTIMFMSFANWQYVDLLSASHWTDVPTTTGAINATMFIKTETNSPTHKFHRVHLFIFLASRAHDVTSNQTWYRFT